MPRNAAGVYTLPNPPRVPNTVIDSPDENTTRDDLASEITNSLDRNGRGGMLAPFRIADGTLAAPGIAFLNEPGTGFWRQGAGVMQGVVQGATVIAFTAQGFGIPNGKQIFGSGILALTGALGHFIEEAAAGAAVNTLLTLRPAAGHWGQVVIGPNVADDSFGLRIDAGTTSNDFSLSVRNANGANHLLVRGSGVIESYVAFHAIASAMIVDPTQPLYLDGGSNTFIAETSPDVVDIIVGGSPSARFFPAGIAVQSGDIIYIDGGSDTFIREIVANRMDFAAGGALMLSLNQPTLFADFQCHISIPAGRRFFPDGGGDTYIWESGANVLDFVVGGSTTFRLNNAESLNTSFFHLAVPPGGIIFLDGGVHTYIREPADNEMVFVTGGVERGRFTGLGYFKASNAAAYTIGGPYHEFHSGTGNNYLAICSHTGSPDPFGIFLSYVNASPNNQGHEFYRGNDNAGTRFIVYSNGGIANYAGNNVNLSDGSVKHYWEPYSVAQLEALSVAVDYMEDGRFKYRDQTHDDWNHGHIAQNVRDVFRDVAPELVDETDWGTLEEKKMLLSVYETDLVNIRLAVAKHEIRKLKAEIATLKERIH